MASKADKSLRRQRIVVIGVVAVIVGLLAWLYGIVLVDAPGGEFVEGEHYQLIDNPRRVRGDKVEVMEFFSYGCIHCYEFDPELAEWVEAHKADVKFVRMPATGSNYWRMLARTYYTMETLGVLEQDHTALFAEIHAARRVLDTPQKIAEWIDGRGTTSDAFLAAFDSPPVDNLVQGADQMGRRLKVASVPTIVVAGKYLVRATSDVGPSRMLDVMDYLVSKEKEPATPVTDPSG